VTVQAVNLGPRLTARVFAFPAGAPILDPLAPRSPIRLAPRSAWRPDPRSAWRPDPPGASTGWRPDPPGAPIRLAP